MQNLSYVNFNEKANIYAQTRAVYSNNYLNIFLNELFEQPDTYIADIAAGTGINTKQIAKYCKKIFAIEPNKEMLNKCRLHCYSLSNH